MEVVRDSADNCIIVCSIENVDPMGIHTGDSVTVAPALTLTDKEYQRMRDASIACLREIGVDTGGSNVQFAVNPADGRMVIIEMNPRVSRSSALASKATGFPIAKIAAKLAVGYTLDELANDITRVTPASFEPTIDYVVVKIPRFTFEKFPGTPALLTTIDEIGRRGDGDRPQLRRGPAEGPAQHGNRAVRPRRDRAARRWRPRCVPRRALRAAPRPAADGGAGAARRPVGRGHPRRLQVRSLVPARTRAHRRRRTRGRRDRPAARCRRAAPAEGARLLRQAPRAAHRTHRGRQSPRCAPGSACSRSTSASTPARRSSPPPRPTCIRPTKAATARRSAKPTRPTARKSSSSAAARTASARASSSTIAASTPPMR